MNISLDKVSLPLCKRAFVYTFQYCRHAFISKWLLLTNYHHHHFDYYSSFLYRSTQTHNLIPTSFAVVLTVFPSTAQAVVHQSVFLHFLLHFAGSPQLSWLLLLAVFYTKITSISWLDFSLSLSTLFVSFLVQHHLTITHTHWLNCGW